MAEKDIVQSFVPMTAHGRTQLVPVTTKSATAKDYANALAEQARITGVDERRRYYAGQQYDVENYEALKNCSPTAGQRLPEHLRRHAYSTQIGECVDYLANRLGAGFKIEPKATAVKTVLDEMVEATDVINSYDDEGQRIVVTDDVLRESLVCGDTPTYVGWDPVEQRLYLEFWESEKVEFKMDTATRVKEVIRTEMVWEIDNVGIERQMVERVVWDYAINEAGVREVRRTRFLDQDPNPVEEPEWLGIGRIPWIPLRADAKSLRSYRGESLITQQAMESADRYNAVEQTGYLIARYNSHSNVAVIGDGASLKLEQDGRISKDVADVLTFPGGTALQVLTLPTDPQMIEHQREVLSEALHAAFGVTRVDPSTIQGLGQVSGYALEILNQKTEGTFSRISRHWRKDWNALIDLALDVHAWKTESQAGLYNPLTGEMRDLALPAFDWMPVEIPDGFIPMMRWWDVDPASVYSDRTVRIRLGSGYIVDDVKIRDDFTAELISREEALRKRGYDDPQIKKIVEEIKKAAPQTTEVDMDTESGTFAGSQQAGSTVAGSTERPANEE